MKNIEKIKEEYKEKEITMIDCETYSYSPEVVYNTTYSEGRNKEIEKKKKRNKEKTK